MCNPYFVKSLNFGTSTHNGDSNGGNSNMSNLESFLQNNPNVKTILSKKCNVFDMKDLLMFFELSIDFVQKQKKFSETEAKLQETVDDMSEWQKAIWEDVINSDSDITEQEACTKFLQLVCRVNIREDPAYKESMNIKTQLRQDQQKAGEAKLESKEKWIKLLREAGALGPSIVSVEYE